MDSQSRNSVSNAEIAAFVNVFPTLPPEIWGSVNELAEIHFDIGRRPRIIGLDGIGRFLDDTVTSEQFEQAIDTIGVDAFDGNNRAGMNGTLHRFSVVRNRRGKPIGLSARFGRANPGLAPGLYDLLENGQSILLIGAPGVGKTSTLRGFIAQFARDPKHRVLIVDTNNEIAGDGDIPHSFVGDARRIQVPDTSRQHKVMIEAVSNHGPTVIAVDEVKTAQEALAVREIAQRGVIVLATVHGSSLLGVQSNPNLYDLLGGMRSATIGDKLASKRKGGFQKNVMQREHEVPFGIAVVLTNRETAGIHWDLVGDIDKGWLGQETKPESRRISH